MTVFLAVVDEGSLSAAGRRLAMPLATVSRKLAELEAHLGARLLNRTTRRLELTDPGRDYEQACRRILDEVAGAEAAVAGEYDAPRGELAITAPIVFGRLHVLPVVNEFLRANAEVDVRLALGDRIAHLLDEHVDVAVRIGMLPDSRLNAVGLGTLRSVICASPDYLKAHGTPRTPTDLARHRCITFDATYPTPWRLAGDTSFVPARPRLVVNTAEAAIDATIAGLGVTRVLSYQADAALRGKQLRLLLRKFEPAPVPVNLVYDGQQRVTSKLRAFLDFAAPRLRQRLAALRAE
ncbi:LysR family transcriptional regulator [Scleromatobacter humisilvae]|uniref:LysR family transcriptional regulator n=1 Tax=Scleromatobacter humisilvae TaxID=2897159 RepID=A0A9X1YHQ6_9BURK|nr:LysR family transcriptional regulator [Scleromatobacter humisilvae]MCK9685090.1 LysR family transcriptional regulator [Scleromatobacter humisilvae]